MSNPPEPLDGKRALLKAAEAAIAQSSGRKPPPDRQRRTAGPNRISIAMALLASAFGIYLMVGQPAWFLLPPPPPDPPTIREAAMRLTLVREASRIEYYHTAAGRLPVSLEEAGSSVAGLRYMTSGNGFTLWWAELGDSLALSSRDSLPLFLGNSLATVMARGGQR